jgi:hypothetical protein
MHPKAVSGKFNISCKSNEYYEKGDDIVAQRFY